MAGQRSETISRAAEARYVHKNIISSEDGAVTRGEFAVVRLRLEPLPRGSGLKFANEDAPIASREFVGGVEEGIREASKQGVIDGGPVVDVRVTLLECVYHEVDSNPRTFSLAAQGAFWEAMRKAGPRLLLT